MSERSSAGRDPVSEDCYRLLTNNCEHFFEWCLRSEARSFQVDAWMALLRYAVARHAVAAVARSRAAAGALR
jgi:hypothetical protein